MDEEETTANKSDSLEAISVTKSCQYNRGKENRQMQTYSTSAHVV